MRKLGITVADLRGEPAGSLPPRKAEMLHRKRLGLLAEVEEVAARLADEAAEKLLVRDLASEARESGRSSGWRSARAESRADDRLKVLRDQAVSDVAKIREEEVLRLKRLQEGKEKDEMARRRLGERRREDQDRRNQAILAKETAMEKKHNNIKAAEKKRREEARELMQRLHAGFQKGEETQRKRVEGWQTTRLERSEKFEGVLQRKERQDLAQQSEMAIRPPSRRGLRAMVLMQMGGMGGGGLGLDGPVPESLRQTHAKFWWAYFVLILASLVVELFALDVFGVLFAGLMAFIVWYMVKNSCKNMSQYCLFIFGVMCMIEALFELLTLVTVIGGRSTSSTTESTSKDEDGNTVVYYTTVVEETPFYDSSQGLTYNAESVGYILSPAVMVVGAILCYFAYQAYDTSLWGDDLEDGRMENFDNRRGGFQRRGSRATFGGIGPPAPFCRQTAAALRGSGPATGRLRAESGGLPFQARRPR
ncbi:unnamed protein product [Prorocentrum cordatum]|uniref:Uncharacterized protein n=1 Tax=Prorocentrum cordatum TaxID=2364126 RepID=A0ABN9PC26_9DINO|nr:unnamed protein product [Polarella glacialis]